MLPTFASGRVFLERILDIICDRVRGARYLRGCSGVGTLGTAVSMFEPRNPDWLVAPLTGKEKSIQSNDDKFSPELKSVTRLTGES